MTQRVRDRSRSDRPRAGIAQHAASDHMGQIMPESASINQPFLYRPNTSDEGVIKQIFHDRGYDLGWLRRGSDLIAYWRAMAEVGMQPLIVDAGANIGAASIYFFRTFPNARIVAIEPDRQNFDILSINAAGLPIECINAAVTSTPVRVRVVDPGEGNWGFRTELLNDRSMEAGPTVESAQIGRIFDSQPHDTYPFIVKIDIEGGEDDLFADAVEWLERTPLVIIELHDWLLPKRQSSRNFLRAVSGLNRDFVHVGENIFSIDNRI